MSPKAPESKQSDPGDGLDSQREELLEVIAESYLRELRAGVAPDKGAIVAAHQEIAFRLERRLTLVQLLYEAASSARRENPSSSSER